MNHKDKRLNLILLLVLFCWIAAGCTAVSLQPTAVPATTVVSAPTARPTMANIQSPTAQSLPSMTPMPSETPTPAPTATQIPPPDDFTQASLFSAGKLDGWNFGLTISLTEPIQGEYYAQMGDAGRRYSCRPLVEYNHPERLFCSGRIPAVEKSVEFQILQKSNDQPVFSGKIYIPL